MTVINTNVGALMARTYSTKANDKMQTSMERLSSGLRINSSADDAAGLAVANKMKSQLNGIKMAIRNSQDGISLVQTAESGMSEISNMILRMRELAVQMENGIYTAKDRDNAQLEVNALLAEIDKIATNTRFNGVKVLDGSYDQSIRAGNTNAETIRVSVDGLKTSDSAKITGFVKNRAVVQSATSVTSTGAATGIKVTMGTTKASTVEIDTSIFSTAFKEAFKSDSLGTFKVSGGTAANFSIDAKTGKLTSTTAMAANTYTFNVVYTPRTGSAHTEQISLIASAASEATLADIKVETTANATHAIESLDKALEEVSSAQAKLGAIQNRLSHNIDNLSKSSMLTEQSVGRVIDADFATETSNLSKQQILAQAATAMLAQANQSKQSVLSLLQ
ncbi:flagellin [Alphaproteobacteria bacterium LSUCC0396]